MLTAGCRLHRVRARQLLLKSVFNNGWLRGDEERVVVSTVERGEVESIEREAGPGAAPLDRVLSAYLLANRDFMAPTVDAAIASLGLPATARVLEAGTGAGGSLPPLARAAAAVEAIDINPAVLPLAADYARRYGVAENIDLRVADLSEVLAEAAMAEGYDAIWASDVVWPGNFVDPGATVAEMAGALRAGGTLALFYSGYYRATVLPGHSRLERLIYAASELRWKLPADGPRHQDLHLAWMVSAGLTDIELTVIPRIGYPVDEVVRTYLEAAVWPEHLTSVRECGHVVGIDSADRARIEALLTPGSDHYVLDEPGYHVVYPAVLATGRRAV